MIVLKIIAENGDKRRIKNVKFDCISWQDLETEKIGWNNKYNFVFAHMTPAINSEATLQKLRSVSKNGVLLQNPYTEKMK